MRNRSLFVIILSFLLPVCFYTQTGAQPLYEPLRFSLRALNDYTTNQQNGNPARGSAMLPAEPMKTDTTPYYKNYLPADFSPNSMFAMRKFKERSWFARKLLFESFIYVDTGRLFLTVDPLMNFGAGVDYVHEKSTTSESTYSDKIYNNTRGFRVQAMIGKKFGVESYFTENQSDLPKYLEDFVADHGVVPGQGRVKSFKGTDFDYSQSGGYVFYAPNRYFNVQLGHHKHFIGYGYRSLILSDNAYNYPFLRFNVHKGIFNYSVLYASFQNLNRLPTGAGSESPFERKGGTFHVLEISPFKKLKISMYQGMIWQTQDSTGKRQTDYNMYNPVIFVNPAVYGMDHTNNALVGIGFKYNHNYRSGVYGTFVTDDASLNRYGVQTGAYYFIFKNLRVQLEWNKVAPNTYYSANLGGRQSFTHYNQPLAHPSGSGFNETVFMIHYRLKRWLAEFRIVDTKYDEVGHMTYVNGVLTVESPAGRAPIKNRFYTSAEIAYLVNPAANLKLYINYLRRRADNYAPSESFLDDRVISLGIRTDLSNFYDDY